MREASRLGRRRLVDIEPEDPSQQLDDIGEIDVAPLDVGAVPAEEAAEELDAAAAENVLGDSEPDDDEDKDEKDTGKLYGVRTPHAADTDLSASEDRDGFAGSESGENWLEALEEHAAELGPAPEEEVVIVDDSGVEHRVHPSEHRDRPVADKGAGGPAGR
jgi:hypothetical protein